MSFAFGSFDTHSTNYRAQPATQQTLFNTLALVLDQPLTYFNPTRKPVRYAVVLATPLNH